jgi:sugar phosphate isomerase/epimerase
VKLKRREFSQLALGALAFHSLPAFSMAGGSRSGSRQLPKVPLGMCDHSLRTLRPDADQLLDYAVEQKLDAVMLNSLRPLESREDAYLERLRARAESNGIGFYLGAGSISDRSTRFRDTYGTGRELLGEGIRVAVALGSPVVVCRIGTIEDRYTEGGIGRHIESVIGTMTSLRQEALAAGVKFAFENHAGDLRSEELLALVEETGTDICGAMLDFGNAIWALEDPINAIELLGPHILCTSVRDVMLWETDDGAIFQWTAVGAGLMDYPRYARRLAELCPGVPLVVESISNSPRPIPFLTDGFWSGFPDLPAAGMVDFLKLLRRGHPLEVLQPAAGEDQKSFDIRYQKSELEASLDYLRTHCHAGLKA